MERHLCDNISLRVVYELEIIIKKHDEIIYKYIEWI